jgi:hypothetical protein
MASRLRDIVREDEERHVPSGDEIGGETAGELGGELAGAGPDAAGKDSKAGVADGD